MWVFTDKMKKTAKIPNFCRLGIFKKNSKKSQMEIMGLVIIIILVSLAMLFVIQFVLLKETTSIKKTYTHTQLAANTLNAITKTTAESCKSQDLTQLLQDCAAYQQQGGLITCDDGVTKSCDYVDASIQEILSKTLDKWNKAYNLTADLAELEFSSGYCAGERQTKIYPIPVPELDAPMILRLDICG